MVKAMVGRVVNTQNLAEKVYNGRGEANDNSLEHSAGISYPFLSNGRGAVQYRVSIA